jgi:SAM-dependent methyltransferase
MEDLVSTYSREYYATRYANTIYSANTILDIVLGHLPTIHSAVDIGCGVGTWLAALRERGVANIEGLDGSWVDQELLVIPRTCFHYVDLTTSTIELPQKYDLAISLEVAEHLPPDRAETFVSYLTALSNYVLFSAAIPFQGGVGHVNERWQHYWAELFEARDCVVHDFIRPRIWNDTKIPFWYRQNMFLFSKVTSSSPVKIGSMPLDVVHPDLYMRPDMNPQLGVRSSFKLFLRALRDYLSKASTDRTGSRSH